MTQILIQSLAIIAVGIFALSFHSKIRRNILLLQIISLLIWSVHFVLLSAWTGAALLFVNIFITIFFLNKQKYKWIDNSIFLSVCIFSLILSTMLVWEGFYSIFALLGVTSITIAKWQDIPNRIRAISILASLFWIVYDVGAGSYGSVISELIIITSILVSLMKNKDHSTKNLTVR